MIETKLTWFEREILPKGDVYIGLVAIIEPNKNHEFHKKIGIPSNEYNKIVLPAIYLSSENKWLSAGVDVTENVQYWTIPTYPKN